MPGWEGLVRRLMDTGGVEVFVTGSSARLLSREVATSLRGRALEVLVHPFSFREALRHAGNEPPAHVGMEPRPAALDQRLRRYLVEGGFPEARGTGGGPWPGAQCGFTVDYCEQGNYTGTIYASGTFTDAQLRTVPGIAGEVDRLKADMRGRNPAMLYGGIAAIAGGAVLALLPGAGSPPMLDVQAGPRGVRLSRTF